VANTLFYYDMAKITAAKSLIVQAPIELRFGIHGTLIKLKTQ
jgi:hypothetical protein